MQLSDMSLTQLRRLHSRLWDRMTRYDGYQMFGYDRSTLWATRPEFMQHIDDVRAAVRLCIIGAPYNRFTISMPVETALACSKGDATDNVASAVSVLVRPAECTVDALRAELKEYGAWDEDELADDNANWARMVWLAACDIRDELKRE